MTEYDDDIRRYRDGSMTGAERNALEKRALDDPFLSDALEGAESIGEKDFSTDLAKLSKRIKPGQSARFIPLRIAAGIAAVLTVGSLLYFFNGNEPDQLATQEVKANASADSISTGPGPDSSTSMLAMAKEVPAEEKITAQPRVPSPAVAAKPQEAASVSDITGEKPNVDALVEGRAKTENETTDLASTNPKAKTVEAAVEVLAEESKSAGAGTKRDASMKRAAASPAIINDSRTVIGNVATSEDGTLLPGVNITIKGTSMGTVTDLRGNYSIAIPLDPVSLSYSFVGLETQEVNPGGRSTVNVQLKEDPSQLSEVVVLGQVNRTEARDDLATRVAQLAAPVGGIRAYSTYLKNNLHYPKQALENKVKGKVTITFTVTTTGSLTDFNVLRGLGYGCEDEVVRLVKEGPAWTPSLEDDLPVESKVRVKLKFDPAKANK